MKRKWNDDGLPIFIEYWAWDYNLQRHIRVPGFNVHRGRCVTADD